MPEKEERRDVKLSGCAYLIYGHRNWRIS